MKRAWEIAKEGQKRFGGKVKEYFAVALKLAWAEMKQNDAEVVICIADHDNKKYILKAQGATYKFDATNEIAFKEKRAHFYYNKGIKTFDYYIIKNGQKKFLERKVVA